MRRSVILACAALLLSFAPPAVAQPAPADPQASARSRAEEGLALFKDGRWDEAFAAFSEADRLFHAPTLVAYMGTCRRNQGRLVEAKALYEKVLAEPVPKDAPEAFKKALETARGEMEKLRGRIPFVKIIVSGPGVEHAKAAIDGVPATIAELAAGRILDPGEHLVTVDAPGASGSSKLALKEGEASRVEVALVSTMAAAPPPPVAPRSSDHPRAGSLLPAGISFGVAGVGLVAGAVTGGFALAQITVAHTGCTAPDASGVQHCPPSNKSAAGLAGTLTGVSTVGFVLGGAGLVTGVVLALVRPGGAQPEKVTLDVGPGSFALRGRF